MEQHAYDCEALAHMALVRVDHERFAVGIPPRYLYVKASVIKWFFRKYEKIELTHFWLEEIVWHLAKCRDICHVLHQSQIAYRCFWNVTWSLGLFICCYSMQSSEKSGMQDVTQKGVSGSWRWPARARMLVLMRRERERRKKKNYGIKQICGQVQVSASLKQTHQPQTTVFMKTS